MHLSRCQRLSLGSKCPFNSPDLVINSVTDKNKYELFLFFCFFFIYIFFSFLFLNQQFPRVIFIMKYPTSYYIDIDYNEKDDNELINKRFDIRILVHTPAIFFDFTETIMDQLFLLSNIFNRLNDKRRGINAWISGYWPIKILPTLQNSWRGLWPIERS